MKDINSIEKIIKKILVKFPDSREDDFILYCYTCREMTPITSKSEFYDAMIPHKNYGLPTFETVTRARRKIFEKCPELKPENITKSRKKRENEFKNYALN
jgi:hypothetical protein